jgi:hypothetical protein
MFCDNFVYFSRFGMLHWEKSGNPGRQAHFACSKGNLVEANVPMNIIFILLKVAKNTHSEEVFFPGMNRF